MEENDLVIPVDDNIEDVIPEEDGSIALGNVVSTINVNRGNYRANIQGIAFLPDMATPGDLVGMVTSIVLNGKRYRANSEGELTLPNLVWNVVIDGQTTTVRTDGSIDISDALEKFINSELTGLLGDLKFVRAIKVSGTVYLPGSDGTVDLGDLEGGGGGGGGGGNVHTGTDLPSDTLGENYDFYYQFP